MKETMLRKKSNEKIVSLARFSYALITALLLSVAFSASNSVAAAPPAANLIISEFRLRGLNGANDEFVEIYNASGATHTVQTNDGSTGYALVASDGISRFIIPNGTKIPGRGHYLGVNAVGYSLSSYPAGHGTTATGDITFTMDIGDNRGIALFNSANPANWTIARRLDAVGPDNEANALYKEGAGYPHLTPFSIDYSFYRDLSSGFPKETNNNAADFVFVDTNGTSAGAGQRLGVASPENLSSPIRRKGPQAISRLDPAACVGCSPNRVRDYTSDPAHNSTFGTIDIRRQFTNNTNSPISRLRFRILDVSTFPAPIPRADLRPRTSTNVSVHVTNGGNVNVRGTKLEEPSSQPNGGGFNSSLSVNSVTLATPLAPGASIKVRFLLGIQQTGKYRFAINVEALPTSSQATYLVIGDTEGGELEARTGGDYDGDLITDLATWNPVDGNWSFVQSSANSAVTQQLGQSGDKPAPGDYDGDGKVDFAVFRPGDATFYILKSSDHTVTSKQFGQSTDEPVPGDYDGDGITDIAVFRPGNSIFYFVQSSTNANKQKKWGVAGDRPVPMDYDGDHKTDFAIFRPSTQVWRIFRSSDHVSVAKAWGLNTDIPVPGDYDKDGQDDIAVWRPSNGHWYVLQSSTNTLKDVVWGTTGDTPQVGDFDGDGKYDFAVWRQSSQKWYVLKSAGAATIRKFGKNVDLPVSSPIAAP